MNVQEIIEHIKKHPSYLRRGTKQAVQRLHCRWSDFLEAKKAVLKEPEYRQYLSNIYKRENTTRKHSPNVPEHKDNIRRLPKILIFDIETSPLRAYVWKRWKENVSLDQTISEWFMLCWSAKWLYSDTVMYNVLTPQEVLEENDSRICKSLWELIDEADIVVAHNGNHFDIPKMNARFIINDLPPCKPFFSVDTCAIAKRQFGFSSNKLDALAEYFGFEHKLDTDFNLWKRCMEGDKEALTYMAKYNQKDVILLEEIYIKLLPWIKNHPNIGNLVSSPIPVCSNCGKSDLHLLEDQYYYTSVGKYNLYRCSCGCVSRGRVNLNKELNKITSVLK